MNAALLRLHQGAENDPHVSFLKLTFFSTMWRQSTSFLFDATIGMPTFHTCSLMHSENNYTTESMCYHSFTATRLSGEQLPERAG